MPIFRSSTLFLSEISCVDHAYIDSEGRIKGGSFLPSFLVSGPVTNTESVVVDFSTIKKDIKALIDARPANTGFDHKLWIMEGFSKCNQTPDFDAGTIELETPYLNMTLPLDAVKFLSCGDYFVNNVGKALEIYLTTELRKIYPGVAVRCVNSDAAQTISKQQPHLGFFNYVHGLKNSTSWGCQNIAHGHRSFIQFDHPLCSKAHEIALTNQLAMLLDDSIYIFKENIVKDKVRTLEIAYTTERGYFRAEYSKNLCKLVVLPTETTIEYLIEDLRIRGREQLSQIKAAGLYLSEGLSKGAYIPLR